jgi:hypothetical protein
MMAPKNPDLATGAGSWRRFFGVPEASFPDHHPPPSRLLHLAIPLLYVGTGTCYALGDVAPPFAVAMTYYLLAVVHILICHIERII